MPLNFEPIQLEQQRDYRDRLASCGQIASDYSFINLWGWRDVYDLQWAWQDGLTWIRQTKPQPALWAPVGDWQTVAWPQALKDAGTLADRIIRVPEALRQLLTRSVGADLQFLESREHWDYLYTVEELIQLKGNRFHKKKNLLNQFLNRYDFRYLPFGGEMVDRMLGMQEEWCAWRDCENNDTLAAENEAILRVLKQWQDLEGITGGALEIEQKISAYTVAELMPDNTLVIHFEKACPEIKGGYQAINQIFLANVPPGPALVNREQDLGDEGLRKAKLSYQPVDFVKKFQLLL